MLKTRHWATCVASAATGRSPLVNAGRCWVTGAGTVSPSAEWKAASGPSSSPYSLPPPPPTQRLTGANPSPISSSQHRQPMTKYGAPPIGLSAQRLMPWRRWTNHIVRLIATAFHLDHQVAYPAHTCSKYECSMRTCNSSDERTSCVGWRIKWTLWEIVKRLYGLTTRSPNGAFLISVCT